MTLPSWIPTAASQQYFWGVDLRALEMVEATLREICRAETLSWFERMGRPEGPRALAC